LRYRGQSYELNIPYSSDYASSFHRAHKKLHGYARPDAEIELVNLRLKATGIMPSLPIPVQQPKHVATSAPVSDYRDIFVKGNWQRIPCYQSHQLQPGMEIAGPALVLCPDTTVLVGGVWFLVVGLFRDLMMVNGYAN
jgi:N-methylhydantoinase A/oxoprolinase/acetone carboxylase beta subunit